MGYRELHACKALPTAPAPPIGAPLSASSASTSASVGIDGAVPGRVTEMPADGAAEAHRRAGSMPRASAGGEAAVEGVARPGRLDHRPGADRRHQLRAPAPREAARPARPSVITAAPTPRAISRLRRRPRLARRPPTAQAGQLLGLGLVRGDVVAEREHARPAARAPGAGFRIVVTPAARAISSPRSAASSGCSSWVTKTDALRRSAPPARRGRRARSSPRRRGR